MIEILRSANGAPSGQFVVFMDGALSADAGQLLFERD
jgi:hypothetical protein